MKNLHYAVDQEEREYDTFMKNNQKRFDKGYSSALT